MEKSHGLDRYPRGLATFSLSTFISSIDHSPSDPYFRRRCFKFIIRVFDVRWGNPLLFERLLFALILLALAVNPLPLLWWSCLQRCELGMTRPICQCRIQHIYHTYPLLAIPVPFLSNTDRYSLAVTASDAVSLQILIKLYRTSFLFSLRSNVVCNFPHSQCWSFS